MTYLVAFDSTHQAMEMESWVKERGLSARLIPTPESITASCGLALKFEAPDLAAITRQLKETSNQTTVYQIILGEHNRKTYTVYQLGGVAND